MRQKVIEALKPLHAISIENRCGVGTPDVNFSGGWLELKNLSAWPAKPETVVAIPHFSPQQRVWQRRRHLAGGGSWVLLQVDVDFLLFTGLVAAKSLGFAVRADLEHLAVGCRFFGTTASEVPFDEWLIKLLTR